MKGAMRDVVVIAVVVVAVLASVESKCKSTGTNCVRSCMRMRSGDYQSCNGCDVYVSCSSHLMYDNRLCPAGLVWNDNIKTCDWSSPTCKCMDVTVSGPVIDGQWSDWDPWTWCSATCDGGTQRRVRRCDDPSPQNGGSDCVGVTTECRPCSQWACPDCSLSCPPGGTLNGDCSQCLCAGDSVSGKVTDRQTSLALANVNIYTVGREWSPSAVSGNDGRFTISGVCVDGLKLTARKDGYESASREYSVSAGSSVSVVMYTLERPTFSVEPASTAGFVGGKASFSCRTTADSDVSQYDWFKDGDLLRSDEVGGGNSGATYNMYGLTKGDEGVYACRAVSLGGKIFSRGANLVVKGAGATDTCDVKPQDQWVPLPPTCFVTNGGVKVKSVNIGRCNQVPCVTRTSLDSTNLCCVPVRTRQLVGECDGFSYKISQIVACGCAECRTTDLVIVSGVVKSGGVWTSGVKIVQDTLQYRVINNQFSFEAKPRAGRILFQVKSKFVMPQLVTLDVSEGVTEMYVEVTLVRKPSPDLVDVATGGEVNVDTPGLPSAVSVKIAPNSFQDKNGNTVSGGVKMYTSFSDPRKPDGLDTAPGQFTFEDSEGETRILKTFGVVTLLAEDANGNEVFLSGKATMRFDAYALGIGRGESVFLWNVEASRGEWQKSGTLTYTGSRRRRRHVTSPGGSVEGQTEIPPNVPYLNCDRPVLRGRLCSIAVFVYYGGDFSIPLQGQRVSAFIRENGLFIGRTSGYTDQNGKACLLVACGLQHIVRLESLEGVMVHPTHFLPAGFAFTNRVNGFAFTATSPATQDDNDKGPVFRYRRWRSSCYSANSSTYHFSLAKPPVRPSLYGSLNAVEARPGYALSWFPNTPADRQVCVLQVGVTVLDPSNMKMVGISSNVRGEEFGVYTSTMLEHTYSKGGHGRVACVVIRCPTNESVYTAVDLHIAYDNSSQCRLRYSQLVNGNNNYEKRGNIGVTKYISHTNNSIQVHVLAQGDGGFAEVSGASGVSGKNRNLYGVGLYRASGPGDLAFYRAMNQCRRGRSNVATFDCSGGRDSTSDEE